MAAGHPGQSLGPITQLHGARIFPATAWVSTSVLPAGRSAPMRAPQKSRISPKSLLLGFMPTNGGSPGDTSSFLRAWSSSLSPRAHSPSWEDPQQCPRPVSGGPSGNRSGVQSMALHFIVIVETTSRVKSVLCLFKRNVRKPTPNNPVGRNRSPRQARWSFSTPILSQEMVTAEFA